MHDYHYNLGSLFHAIAREHAGRTALKFPGGACVSYREMDELSDRIAAFLAGRGVSRNDVVAILNNKSRQSYAAMLACLKLGAIYTNLDPRSPIERFMKMMQLCSPKVLLYYRDAALKTVAEEFESSVVTMIDYTSPDFERAVDACAAEFPRSNHAVTGATPAYIMFTSGSTGFPKGVVITHANILNFIDWTKKTYSTTTDDVFTNINPMHFDNSVFDFYASLFSGAALIPVGEELTRNPRRLLDALNPLGATVWFSVPSMLVYVLNMRALKDGDLPALRIVTFGGEGFPKNQLRVLWAKWGARVSFINVYGPTECTCICSSYRVSNEDMASDELLPLGPIAPNFSALVLDAEGRLTGEGETGELLIGGPNVGLGYFNNPAKTSEVFVANPFVTTHTERFYRSGDLVRYDKAKDLFYFCGRKDNQIKRMGYRIELEEIEAALNSLDYIAESAVVYLNSEKHREQIVACICADGMSEERITDNLGRMLPTYMIPNRYVRYTVLPKNQNGKIDRLQLKRECER